MPEKSISRDRMVFMLLLLLGVFGLVMGWRLFWFLTDDAFIAFRYISNSVLGHGYVWNPPPFRPVEGYTSFLWVLMLDGCWRMFGTEPPQIANYISLLFSIGTLFLGACAVLKIQWTLKLQRHRMIFVGLFMLYLTTNRTFLAWSSSGLETAMFTFFIMAWVYAWGFMQNENGKIFFGSLSAALLALTRPDGLLFCMATVLLVSLVLFGKKSRTSQLQKLVLGGSSMLLVVVHLIWRKLTYGEWLPNTYYAKVVEAWPKSGLIYLGSFILEYGVWFIMFFLVLGVIRAVCSKRHLAQLLVNGFLGLDQRAYAILIITGTVLFHMGYYTLKVGGDHFEFRVYTQLIPLLFIAFVWSLNHVRGLSPRLAVWIGFGALVFSLPTQWSHWELSRHESDYTKTTLMFVPIEDAWPAPFKWYARAYDSSQEWLIGHMVCIRHQEHKNFYTSQVRMCPSRVEGAGISDDHPVMAAHCVGVKAWTLPNTSIIDCLGLNDYVIARIPVEHNEERRMAHDRNAPRDYVMSFQPNVFLENGVAVAYQRKEELTAERIARSESAWIDTVR